MSLVVLASGNGSNLQALLDAALPVAAVVSDRPGAYALTRAETAGIAAVALPRGEGEARVVHGAGLPLPRGEGEARAVYDARLAEAVAAHQPSLVVLAGWMRILTMAFLGRFPAQVVNLHPALPGEYPGTHAIERAFADRATRTHTGVMVHLVPDEGVDDGPVLATATVAMRPGDTLDALEARVHEVEHRLLVATVHRLLASRRIS